MLSARAQAQSFAALTHRARRTDARAMSIMWTEYGDYFIRLAVATAIGGLIGIEREMKGKPAGMRTNILMCLGSCLIMILSIETARRAGPQADPGRIAAQVVTGVGFLGAGTILRSRVTVTGLTSAATIWFVAALGLVIGSGDFVLALAATTLMILTLTALARVERRFEVMKQLHIVRVRAPGKHLAKIRALLLECRVMPDDLDVQRVENGIEVHISYVALERKHTAFVTGLYNLEGVEVILAY